MARIRLVILLLGFSFSGEGKLFSQIVVIVNGKNPVESLSLVELRNIYTFETTDWRFPKIYSVPIHPLDYKENLEIVNDFYREMVGMSQWRIRLFWMGKLLNGEIQTLLETMLSDEKMIEYVSKNEGAIGFVTPKSFDPSMKSLKAVKIDGKFPG